MIDYNDIPERLDPPEGDGLLEPCAECDTDVVVDSFHKGRVLCHQCRRRLQIAHTELLLSIERLDAIVEEFRRNPLARRQA